MSRPMAMAMKAMRAMKPSEAEDDPGIDDAAACSAAPRFILLPGGGEHGPQVVVPCSATRAWSG